MFRTRSSITLTKNQDRINKELTTRPALHVNLSSQWKKRQFATIPGVGQWRRMRMTRPPPSVWANWIFARSKPMMSELAKNRVLSQDPREIGPLQRCADEFPGIIIRIFLHQDVLLLKCLVFTTSVGLSEGLLVSHRVPSNTCFLNRFNSPIFSSTFLCWYHRTDCTPNPLQHPTLTSKQRTPESRDTLRTTQECGTRFQRQMQRKHVSHLQSHLSIHFSNFQSTPKIQRSEYPENVPSMPSMHGFAHVVTDVRLKVRVNMLIHMLSSYTITSMTLHPHSSLCDSLAFVPLTMKTSVFQLSVDPYSSTMLV